MHYKGCANGYNVPCFFLWHDNGYCGLTLRDFKETGAKKDDWKHADSASVESNRKAGKRALSGSNSASTVASSHGVNNTSNEEWNDNCV